MVEKISVEIALEGGPELQKQFAAATSSISKLGNTAEEAFAGAAAAAQKFSATTAELGGVNTVIAALARRAQDGGKSFSELATNYDNATASARELAKSAVETGPAFNAAAVGVAALGAAIVSAGVALSHYISQAAKVAEALRPLADLSGQAIQSVSELQIAFARGGVSAQKFASEFTALEQKVQEAAATMAADVEASSQRIEQAHQASAAAGLSLKSAELNLQKIELARREKFRGIDPIARRNIARAQASLQLEQAEQQVAAAELARRQAEKAATVAEANDLKKIIQLYQQMGGGVKVAFDPLTTQATKNTALLATLAKAGNNWKSVLADILKNATELERIQIGKAVGLDQNSINLLKQGSDELRHQQQLVRDLGLALNDVDSSNLKAFTDNWNILGATASAALQKIGAMLAPLGTLLAKGLTTALVQVVQGIQTTITEFQALWKIIDAIAGFGAKGISILVTLVTRGLEYAATLINLIAGIGAKGIDIAVRIVEQGLLDAWTLINEIVTIAAKGISIVVDFILSGAIGKLIEILKQLLRLQQGPQAPLPEPGGIPGFGEIPAQARGGLLGGRGSGTSDSNLAWVSRGEHIMPARAVAQPGVLAFLEALRRSGGNLSRVLDGMGRFALGGMVPRMPAFAAGGLAGGSNVTIQFPGLPAIGGLRASSDVVDQLHRAAALAQVRSGGRKPSRYA